MDLPDLDVRVGVEPGVVDLLQLHSLQLLLLVPGIREPRGQQLITTGTVDVVPGFLPTFQRNAVK